MSKIVFQSHDAGLFSTTTIMLFQIINYYKKNNNNPTTLDSSNVFSWYRYTNEDIFFNFFKIKNLNSLNNISLNNFDYDLRGDIQFKKYSDCNLDVYFKYVDVYFNLSNKVMDIYENMIHKYKINADNMCSLFLRGNDKATECDIPTYDKYIEKGNELLRLNPNLTFLIQSDEKEFIDTMSVHFPNNIIFTDEIRTISKNRFQTVDKRGKTPEINHKYALNFLAVVYIMSKSKYVVCNSGNISFWILMYRKQIDNYFQL